MDRSQCIEMMYPELEDKLVVTIMGACAQELYDLMDRALNKDAAVYAMRMEVGDEIVTATIMKSEEAVQTGVRVSDIAAHLGTKLPTVTRNMARLR